MANGGSVYAVDERSSQLFTAELKRESGRVRVVQMRVQPTEERFQIQGGQLSFTVPDSDALVTPVRLPKHLEHQTERNGLWELEQRLLEPAGLFETKVQSTALDVRMLGFAWRKSHLQERTSMFLNGTEQPCVPSSRALSLGIGFLKFCQLPDGDLIAIVDIRARQADICFVYRRRPFDIVTVNLMEDATNQANLKRLGTELKTVMNMRMSSFSDWGVNLPLAAVVVYGESADGRVRTGLSEFFPCGIRQPDFLTGYFGEVNESNSADRALFLPALGAAVNSLA